MRVNLHPIDYLWFPDPGHQVERSALNIAIHVSVLAACFVVGCGPSIASKDSSERLRALGQITDQTALTKIALGHYRVYQEDVKMAAVDKLTDQALLAKIALEGDFSSVGPAATRKLTDKAFLAKIAFENHAYQIREAAVENLSAKVVMKENDWRVRSIYQACQATSAIPDKDRFRLVVGMLEIFRILNDPSVMSVLGEIVTVKGDRSDTAQRYRFSGTGALVDVPGEIFHCTIQVRNLPEPMSATWITSFPLITNSRPPRPAEIEAGKLLRTGFARLPQATLAKFALEEKNQSVQVAAVECLTDQALLAKIALKPKPWDPQHVRLTAISKLTDQAPLARIAFDQTADVEIRVAAVYHLTDQTSLAKIALEPWDLHIRLAAVDKLTDQALLAKIAFDQSADWEVRRAAVENLTDQAALAKIPEESILSVAAKERLRKIREGVK